MVAVAVVVVAATGTRQPRHNPTRAHEISARGWNAACASLRAIPLRTYLHSLQMQLGRLARETTAAESFRRGFRGARLG